MGNPEKAKDSIMGIMTVARIFKNLFFFPIEAVVITLFLKVLVPVTQRAGLTYDSNANLSFTKKQIAVLVLLVVVGIGSAMGYLSYRYESTSRSASAVIVSLLISIFFGKRIIRFLRRQQIGEDMDMSSDTITAEAERNDRYSPTRIPGSEVFSFRYWNIS